MKKKFLSLMLVFCFIIPCAFAMVACKKPDDATAKVMNVGLNPKLEFILDKNDKVLYVNALNEDGNHIISASIDASTDVSQFEGLDATAAVELFLEITKENGYLITGNEEEIKIEISGDANALMQKVKDKANKFLADNGLTIDIDTDKIEKSDIIDEVKKCVKEYTEIQLRNMSQEQLINLLKESREETKNLLTQELKEAYYNIRVEKINMAELEALLTLVEGLSGAENAFLNEFEQNMATLKSNLEALETAYNDQLIAETSAYNQAKQTYIQAKEDLLAKRLELGVDGISEGDKEILQSFETAVENAEDALEDAKDSADQALVAAKSAVTAAISTIQSSLQTIKTALSALGINLDAINEAKEQVKDAFKNHFEQHEHFGDHIGLDKGHWGE